MSKGVLYIAWKGGPCDPEAAIERSVASLEYWHPELDYHIAWMPEGSDLRCKSQMYDLSPFSRTLFLDADTVVMGRLDYGFDMAEEHGLACCICCCPWARRYAGLRGAGDTVEYDTGVLFFDKSWRRFSGDGGGTVGVEHVFAHWKKQAYGLDSSCRYLTTTGVQEMPVNDQASFADAIDGEGFNPFVLPSNFNVHPKWTKMIFGPIKVWHDYGPLRTGIFEWNREQSEPGAVIKCINL